MKTLAVIMIRGGININRGIKDTLKMLNLTKVNHCVFIPETKEYKGMLQKVKDYVTWGEIDSDTLTEMIKERGRLKGDKPVTDKYIEENGYISIKKFVDSVIEGEIKYSFLKDVKPVIRLHPPRKGLEGIKRSYAIGGALGCRGKEINELLRRMI
ncbi:MAG: 50S ribosomal protein L30 [Candidatus Thermoplasmatota archaeon]|nr:50S ribosomal protein L30 [Candidatus Thermoplasmatota archaeon]MBU3902251.1 50S ribosomal protein L30 [Candidatus Thermoplasmatota archaeon]